MNQYQSIDFPHRNELRSNGSLAKCCGSAKNSLIVSGQSFCRLQLSGTTIAAEVPIA